MGQGAVPGQAGTAGRDYGYEAMRWQAAGPGHRVPASPGQQTHPAGGPAHDPAPPRPAGGTPPGMVHAAGAMPAGTVHAAGTPHTGMPRHTPPPVPGPGPAAAAGPAARAANPEDLAGLAVIGNRLRVPVAHCEAGRCMARYEDPSALGEADVRARAIAAGWRETMTGMLTCPSCQQRAPWPGFRPGRPHLAR
jgi:hypothetical protein